MSIPTPSFCRPSLSADLADWVYGLRLDHIPDSVLRHARRLLLDTLAIAWPGGTAAGVPQVCAHIAEQGGRPEAVMWGTDVRLPMLNAIFVNGLSAAALDYDSVHDEATVHPDIILVPALLALAEREGKSGRAFLEAYVAGSEMLVRLGLGVTHNPGWFLSSVLGTFATAAAAAKLMDLDARGIHRAMGICLSRAAGSQQTLLEGSFTKRLQSAFAARDGVEAALLARCGVTAPEQIFEGSLAFEKLYVELDPARVLDALGKEYRCEALTLKDYPSCFCNHAAILAARELRDKHSIRAEDIASCEVVLTPFSARMVGAPFEPTNNPQVLAQFSASYSVANVLLRGSLDVADIQPEAVLAPDVLALAKRIHVVAQDDQNDKFTPATVTIRTVDGERLSATIDRIPGTPTAPFSDAQLQAKAFRSFSQSSHPVTPEWVAALIQRIEQLDRMSNIQALLHN